jgi:ribonuclease HI
MVEVWIDGSCKLNGTKNARASFGVFYSKDNPKNYCALLDEKEVQTNNRAELHALIYVLEREKDVIVYCDSSYVVNGTNSWIHKWKQNNWITSSKQAVLNQDLWIKIDNLKQNLKSLIWVKGHKDNVGNIQADLLASSAFKKNQ